MIIFRAENIVKQYNGLLALDKVSLDVPRGSIYGLLGPNGAGKTTLIRIINRITAPDGGKVYFRDHKLGPADISSIGYLPEERGLYRKMKVGEQAVYLARLKGLSKRQAVSSLQYWSERLEIRGWWNKKVEELSKGMQQKIQFIVTILHEPDLIIFDEPFSGFDPINANLLKKEVLALRDKGATIIFSTHDMGSVEELCDHITLIDKGRSILQGTISEIRQMHRSDTYSIIFHGDFDLFAEKLGQGYRIVGHNHTDGAEHVLIRISGSSDGNRLLGLVLPVVRVKSFSEVIPGMNDIFIRAVKGNADGYQTGTR